MKVLVINAGSSSIKYHLYQMPQVEILAKGEVGRIGEESSELSHFFNGEIHTAQTKVEDVGKGMELILDTLVRTDVGVIRDLPEIGAVGHRVVHGGEEFTGSVIIDEKVIASIEKFADLAPLHNPPNLAGIQAVQRRLPDAKQVACFDTAFHATIPKAAYMYALPYELYEKYGIRRYGFHGISHRYVARRAAAIMGRRKYDINAVTCHLGSGCSITAVKQGRSIDTSMGFTPLEGVPMGTRSGDLDPAILFYLGDRGYDVKALKELCNKKSGLLGISGISNDVRNLEKLAGQGNSRAKLAIDVFCYRIKKYIGVYCAVLETVDAVVFTGGIGENSVFLRQKICNGLHQLGVQLDEETNRTAVAKETEISTMDSGVKIFVIPTNEQVAIANDTYELTRYKVPIVSEQNADRNSARQQMEVLQDGG
jgi:acetate kinase